MAAKYTSDELAQLGYSANIWLKLLRAREKRVLDQMYAAFRSGQSDFLAEVTEYSVLREQIREIEQAITTNPTKEL